MDFLRSALEEQMEPMRLWVLDSDAGRILGKKGVNMKQIVVSSILDQKLPVN